jgi:hypothetical protein
MNTIKINSRPVLIDRIKIVVSPNYMDAEEFERNTKFSKNIIGCARLSNLKNNRFYDRKFRFHYEITLPDDFTNKYPFINNVRVDACFPYTVVFTLNFIRLLRLIIENNKEFNNAYDQLIRLDENNYLNNEIWSKWDNNQVETLKQDIKPICRHIAKQAMGYIVRYGFDIDYINVTVRQLETNVDYYIGNDLSLWAIKKYAQFINTNDGIAFRKKLSEIALKHYAPIDKEDGQSTRNKNETDSIQVTVGEGFYFKVYRKTRDHIRAELTFNEKYVKKKFTSRDIDKVIKALNEFTKDFFKKVDFKNELYHMLTNGDSEIMIENLHEVFTTFEIGMPQINDIIYSIICNKPIDRVETRTFISKNKGLKHQFVSTRNKYGRPILYFNRDEAIINREDYLNKLNELLKRQKRSDEQQDFIIGLYKEMRKNNPDERMFVKNDHSGLIYPPKVKEFKYKKNKEILIVFTSLVVRQMVILSDKY